MIRVPTSLCVLAICIFIFGCEGETITESEIDQGGGGGLPTFTFTAIQTQIFTPTCATTNCHVGQFPQQGLDLSAGNAYSEIVNVQSTEMQSLLLVKPGSSSESYLINKLRGTGITGLRMPNGQPALSTTVIDSIAAWIDRGAANN